MEISPYFLTLMLLWSFFFGCAVGVLNDLHRLSRIPFGVRYSKRSFDRLYAWRIPLVGQSVGEISQGRIRRALLPVVIFFQDIFLFIVAAVGIAVISYYFNSGRLRLYPIVGTLLGFLLYYFTLGRLVMLLSEGIVCLVRMALSFLSYLITRPFVLLWHLLCRMGKKIAEKIREALEKRRKMVYNKREIDRVMREARRGFLREADVAKRNA